MSIEELKRLAQAASDVSWMHLCRENPVVFGGKYAAYISAANPAAVLELIAEVEKIRDELDFERLRLASCGVVAMQNTKDSRKDRIAPDHRCYSSSYGDVCRAVDAEIDLRQQRDELLASLKEARELVEDWGAYAPAYMQEKHDLEGDMNKLDAAIARAEAI